MDKPSYEFMDAACIHHSDVITCEFCGRTHYAGGSQSGLSDEDLEEYAAKASATPDKFHFTTDDCVAWAVLDGKQAAFDCPCNAMKKYEDWIWMHREMIVAYLKARTSRDLSEANYNAKVVNGVASIQ